jgi:superoxide dismutase, Fe-Mn family
MKKYIVSVVAVMAIIVFGAFANTYTHDKTTHKHVAAKSCNSTIDISKLADNAYKYPYMQPALGYAYDALEPNIDKLTMEIHYSKHHKAYTDKFNETIKGTELEKIPLLEIFQHVSKYPAAIRNFGGGFYNHLLYFSMMAPNSSGKPEGSLAGAILNKYGSFDQFKNEFSSAAKTLFGSGWTWLSVDDKGALFISTTANQDNPLMDIADKHGIPVLCIDVWEHAYYLKYQNKRADYITAFWNVVNWKEAEKRYQEALKIEGK